MTKTAAPPAIGSWQPRERSALESKAIGPAPGKRSLTGLTDDDFDAGLKDSKTFYTMERLPVCSDPVKVRGIQAADFSKLHDLGHLMPDELLADYFLNTLFQYNTWRAMHSSHGAQWEAGKLALGAFLADYKPDFIDQPYYAFYMKNLKALTQAVHQIDDVKF